MHWTMTEISTNNRLTLSPFSFGLPFQFFNLTFSSPSDSAAMTRSLACNSSHGQPVLKSWDRASITIIKKNGLRTDPWCMYSHWCNVTLARLFGWSKCACGWVKFQKYVCLVAWLGEQLLEKQILKIILVILW